MGVFDKLRRNPIDKMKLSELREEQMMIKNRLERIRKDVNKLDEEKKKKFKEGIGADLIKKKMLAQEIKQLDMEQKLNLKDFITQHKNYMLYSNLIMIKRYEQQLKKTKLWNQMMKISPDQLERILVRINLSGKEFDDVLDELNRVFEIETEEFETAGDESEKQLLEAWSSVETGAMDAEDAEKMLSVESSLKEKEKEK